MAAWSGLYNLWYNDPYTGVRTTRQMQFDLTVNKMFRKIGSQTALKLLIATIGAAAGGTATATYSRVAPSVLSSDPSMYGGLRSIETKTLINRATTAADVTALKAIFSGTGNLTRIRSAAGRDIPHNPNAFA
jgi:hypothetical protein